MSVPSSEEVSPKMLQVLRSRRKTDIVCFSRPNNVQSSSVEVEIYFKIRNTEKLSKSWDILKNIRLCLGNWERCLTTAWKHSVAAPDSRWRWISAEVLLLHYCWCGDAYTERKVTQSCTETDRETPNLVSPTFNTLTSYSALTECETEGLVATQWGHAVLYTIFVI